MRDDDLGRSLLTIARRAIGDGLGARGIGGDATGEHPALAAPGATFVTLFRYGTLRGCVGTLEARRALKTDVRANAIAAAFSDPRFRPLSAAEFPETSVEVSLLSAPEPVTALDERSLLYQLRPGVDGVVIEHAGARATFLPQVWETLPEPADFLAELKRKAGMPADFWTPAIKVSRYGVTKWRESDLLPLATTP
jgi:AmmeMemoRadiSam system protein A